MVKKFKYKLLFDWNFSYGHVIDYHTNLRHALTSIEDTWMIDLWECWVFAFILAISEVNAFLILLCFVYCGLCWEGMPTVLDFCQKLSWQLINNTYIGEWEGGVKFFLDSMNWLMTVLR